MFKFIFDILTEPLGLPIEWYYEWLILGLIGVIAYKLAFNEVGQLYRAHFISGKSAGSLLHWIIRSFWFIIIWAVTYFVIWVGKFIKLHLVEVGIGIAAVISVAIIIKLVIWIIERNKLEKVNLQNKKGDIK